MTHSPAQKRARHQVSQPNSSTALTPPSFPTRPVSSISMDSRSEGPSTVDNYAHCRQVMLPDDVLLAIFDFCVDKDPYLSENLMHAWQRLVHVCRQWRSVVFASPRRLNLRLFCSPSTTRDMLCVWPALPLAIMTNDSHRFPSEDVDNIIALLENSNRVYETRLENVPRSHLEKITAAMQKPFPELATLLLGSNDEVEMVLPDSFLGRSAPSLQYFWLDHIPFPGLPNLLLSATHLVNLRLWRIPHSGYISPEAMVSILSSLTALEGFTLGFESPQSRPGLASRRLPPQTPSVLPSLKDFDFHGVSEYLDDFVAHIDAPQLKEFNIKFFNDIVFDTPQLVQFITRSPMYNAPAGIYVTFDENAATAMFSSQLSDCTYQVAISCRKFNWQVSSLEQAFTSCFPPFSMSEDLYVDDDLGSQPDWQDDIEDTAWLELLHPFIAVKNLYLSEKFGALIMPALKEPVGGWTTEVLPMLQNIYLEGLEASGPIHEAIRKFVTARQVTGHPIGLSRWDR